MDLTMTAGLPYRRRIRVTEAASIWATASDFEVRSQIRVDKDVTSTLKGSLTPFLTGSIEGEDLIVDLELTGQDTRTLPRGYFDIVVSDVGSEDAHAITILSGSIKLKPLVTAASDV